MDVLFDDTINVLEAKDTFWLMAIIGIIAVARKALDRFVLEPLANAVVPEPNPEKLGIAITKKDENSRQKFRESGFRFVYYTTSWALGFICSVKKDWFWDTELLWAGYPNHPFSIALKFYYLTALAYYIYSLITLNSETKRKDHTQMAAHHIFTIILVACSCFFGLHRAGTMILLCHDISDPFMELAKMFNYAKNEKAANAAFATFFVVWVVSRLMYFPAVLVRTVAFDMTRIITDEFLKPWCMLWSTILLGLQVMHLIWTKSIVHILWVAIMSKGVKGDVRED